MVAKLYKEAFYLVLKQNDQYKQSDAHKLIKDCPDQLQAQYLGGKNPYNYKSENTKKYINCAAFFHYPVKIKKKQCHDGYIEGVSYAELFQFFL